MDDEMLLRRDENLKWKGVWKVIVEVKIDLAYFIRG